MADTAFPQGASKDLHGCCAGPWPPVPSAGRCRLGPGWRETRKNVRGDQRQRLSGKMTQDRQTQCWRDTQTGGHSAGHGGIERDRGTRRNTHGGTETGAVEKDKVKGREMKTPRHTEGDKEMERETETEGQTQSCRVRPSFKENTRTRERKQRRGGTAEDPCGWC